MDTGKDMVMVIMEVVAMDMVIMVIMEEVDMDIMEEVDMDIMEEEGMDTTTKAITMEKDLSAPLNILYENIEERSAKAGYGIGRLSNGYGNGQ